MDHGQIGVYAGTLIADGGIDDVETILQESAESIIAITERDNVYSIKYKEFRLVGEAPSKYTICKAVSTYNNTNPSVKPIIRAKEYFDEDVRFLVYTKDDAGNYVATIYVNANITENGTTTTKEVLVKIGKNTEKDIFEVIEINTNPTGGGGY